MRCQYDILLKKYNFEDLLEIIHKIYTNISKPLFHLLELIAMNFTCSE